jgi:hypothetical protein
MYDLDTIRRLSGDRHERLTREARAERLARGLGAQRTKRRRRQLASGLALARLRSG